jgi:SAM-dependent methyltransferase
MGAPPVSEWLQSVLCCPACAEKMAIEQAALACTNCGRRVPIRDGVPTFVEDAADEIGRRTQSSFGYEWQEFADWRPSGQQNFESYFIGCDLDALAHADVLDAGCGMGRHARFMAQRVARLIALDFSAAVESARQNLREFENVACVRADLRRLPFAPATFDFIYSLGVVHHIADTDEAVRALADKLRPGGRLRIYVYWARQGASGWLLRLVAAARTITTRMPFPLLRVACRALSAALWVGIVGPYRALGAMGVDVSRWPLSVYTKYPFNVLYNDQFDRFSAPIEKRYTAQSAHKLLADAGLTDISVRECFGWVAEGRKP